MSIKSMSQLHPLVKPLLDDKTPLDDPKFRHARVLTVLIEGYERFTRDVEDAAEYGNSTRMKEAIENGLEKLTALMRTATGQSDEPEPDPTMSEAGRAKIRKMIEAGAKGDGLGGAPAEWCQAMLERCDDWKDWDWFVLGMQVGVVE